MGQAEWKVVGFIQRLLAFIHSRNHYLFEAPFCQAVERKPFHLCIYWDVSCKQDYDTLSCEIRIMRFFQFLFGYSGLLPIIYLNDFEIKAIELIVGCHATLPINFPLVMIPNLLTFYSSTR